MKLNASFATATLVLALMAVPSAEAQGCQPIDNDIKLTATKLGDSIGAIGTAGVYVAEDCGEIFGVAVSAQVPKGTTFTVVVSTKAATYRAGAMPMFGGFGQLVLDSHLNVSDVFPVGNLKTVRVLMTTTTKSVNGIRFPPQPAQVLLEGTF